MKNKILITITSLLLLIACQNAFSQGRKLPPFKILQGDGKLFRAQDLPVGKPIIIIYFSPECEDCQEFTEAMLSRMDDFWNASIAMITYLPVQSVAQFVKKYKLNIYPNIFVGTEGNAFIVRYYFNIKRFPFVALFNKDGTLIKIWDKKEDINDLAEKLKGL